MLVVLVADFSEVLNFGSILLHVLNARIPEHPNDEGYLIFASHFVISLHLPVHRECSVGVHGFEGAGDHFFEANG